MRTILSIDPGLSIGYALWDYAKNEREVKPLQYGSFRPQYPRTGKPLVWPWEERVKSTLVQFERWLFDNCKAWGSRGRATNIVEAFIENASYFGTARGACTVQSGSLVKLTYTVGWLSHVLTQWQVPITLVSTMQWKGQLTKAAVQKRIIQRIGELPGKVTSHTWDAIGVGLWARGHF